MIDLLVLGVIIAIEPLPVIGFILVLSTDHARRNGLAFIAAWVLSLIAIVVATLALTGGHPPSHKSSPALGAAVATLVVGMALLYIAVRVHQLPPDRPRKQPSWMKRVENMTAWGAALLGFLLQPWGLIAAAATIVVEADISTAETVVVLVGFCLLATSALATMEAYVVLSPEAARDRLNRLRGWLERHRDQGIVILSASVGVWLTGKGIYLILVQRA